MWAGEGEVGNLKNDGLAQLTQGHSKVRQLNRRARRAVCEQTEAVKHRLFHFLVSVHI